MVNVMISNKCNRLQDEVFMNETLENECSVRREEGVSTIFSQQWQRAEPWQPRHRIWAGSAEGNAWKNKVYKGCTLEQTQENFNTTEFFSHKINQVCSTANAPLRLFSDQICIASISASCVEVWELFTSESIIVSNATEFSFLSSSLNEWPLQHDILCRAQTIWYFWVRCW